MPTVTDLTGPAGHLEALLDLPASASDGSSEPPPHAAVVFAHPHPQFGGTMHTKVMYQGAKGLARIGCAVLRFNFRGVGGSAGTFDQGEGEKADFRAALDYMSNRYPGKPLWAAGFSFGAWVALEVGALDDRVSVFIGIAPPVASSTSGMVYEFGATLESEKPKFLIQGEADELCPLEGLWRFYSRLKEPKELVVIDSADHLFEGKTQEVGEALEDLLEGFYVTTTATTRGGAWLVEDVAPGAIFTVEKFSDEHRLIARTADDFMQHEVAPALERLEQKDWSLARTLLQRCGALGLIGTDVPEAYGGVDVDKVSSIIVGEAVGMVASFATTFGAQSGLSVTPLLCFGTDDQKARYLPRLVTGELIGAYALSESGSGSDALGAKTRATRREDGSYLLTGEKMWISNGGFADLFIVFAKVDGEHFSAFLVERSFPGVSTGKEEHKMGLHGSSTTPLILQEAVVPAGQLLGEIGKGHKVAFNVLNYGRFKLAAMCSGGARAVIGEAARYAKERKQFGQPIASFGAIRHKLAEMTVREFAVESMLYRTAGLIDGAVHGSHAPDAVLSALEEFAIEASALKVASSEMLDYVVDENVQIHGGNGFVRDYPAERHYRDARVNRIFEGTNEINRLLLPGLLVRRALRGGLPLIDAARTLQDDLRQPSAPEPPVGTPLETELRTVGGMKKVAVLAIGAAMRALGEKLADQQEIVSLIADIVIDVFAAESSVLRAAAMAEGVGHAAARVFVKDAASRVEVAARTALAGMAEGDTLRAFHAALPRLLSVSPANTIALRRQIADAVLVRPGYPFS